jgi:ankyrin repeat protein
MKTKLMLLVAVLVSFNLQAADDLTTVLQQGLFNEEADHDLAAAIKAYQFVVTGADAQRKLAATAVFRLGECYRKLGQTNEANAQYQRILDQFTDQTNLVALSRQNLGSLRMAEPLAAHRNVQSPAQVEAQRLLIERLELEIKTTEAEVARYKELIRRELVPDNSADKDQARLLDLRRQLILARDAGPTGTADGTAGADAPLQNLSPAARSQLKELLQGEITVASQLLAEQRKRAQVGSISPEDVWRFERDVLGLNRQLLAVDGLVNAEDRKRWRDILIDEIALAEKAVKNERAKLDAGRSIASELAKLQRDVFALKRELVAFDAAPSQSTSTVVREAAATDEEDREVRRIQALIKDSPDLVNAKSVEVGKFGDSVKYGTPLHKAAQQGQLVVARFLIENGADLDSRDGFGRTALHWAALNGHKSMAELLLARGADPNAFISAGPTSAGFTPLHFAAQNGYRNVCEALLVGKADLNARTESDRATPLHQAAARGFTSVAELLLARGAEVNARNMSGSTPLASAASGGMKNAVQLLLVNKADINAQNDKGETALFAAVSAKRGEVVQLLLAGKANPNLAFNEKSENPGWTPLVAAINQDNAPVARLLLENGANPNVLFYRNGWTALMQAAQKGSVELVEALLAAGADVNAKENADSRSTALYHVAYQNPTNAAAIVELLLRNKADVNLADVNGVTPLIRAVGRRNLDVVRLLVEHGADVNAMTRQGESPLSLIKPQRQAGLSGPVAPPIRLSRPGGIGGVSGQPSQPSSDPTPEIIALLEQRGARDDLRRLSAISTSRNQEDRRGWFFKGTNDWNQFTLLELIAWVNPRRNAHNGYLDFPDLTRVAISRIDPGRAKTDDIRLDIASALVNGDCSKDMPLQWGDVVDIPEEDHFVNAVWERFPDGFYKGLQQCLERAIRVTIKGQTTNVALTPFRESKPGGFAGPAGPSSHWESRMGNFRLNGFLRNSGLLLSSSDVTRVKVRRIDSASNQVRERVFDLDQIQNQIRLGEESNDLWLRDGDVIEVPEKDPNRAAGPAAGAAAVPDGTVIQVVPSRSSRRAVPPPDRK